ncbi:MAG: DUF3143 domain-containing protein [Leptolyngbyaceae cyanobacterium HOT.MB2.61]|jgi:hypothetical protein|nr:DUF3143 domain-containing protein [Leptolyngbyaceae cyanobacterium HOT.MB2.61]
MTLPPPETPLYNHPLPDIEQWLVSQGCVQDKAELHCWRIERPDWNAELCLDIDQLTVRYFNFKSEDSLSEQSSQSTIQRAFKYSLSRKDIEDAVFAGP